MRCYEKIRGLQTKSNFRLLVVRLGAMGDILHALPAVNALRQAHPEWRIDWVVEPRWRALLTGAKGETVGLLGPTQPLVNRVYFAATKSWGKRVLSLRTGREILALRRELRAAEYNAVLDPQGSIKSAVVASFAGCGRVIGSADPTESVARWFYNEPVKLSSAHVIDQALELACAVAGDELEPVAPLLPMDDAAEKWCDELLATDDGSSKIVLMNPGAGWGAKCWPIERYAAVAASLVSDGYSVLVNAGPGEENLAEVIRAATVGSKNLCAIRPVVCTIEQLIALTRRVALVIAGDTGPLHLACALGKPVVGIYGPTDPSRNGPYGTRFKVLRSPESKRDHRRLKETEAGLLTITEESVLSAARELLSENVVGGKR